LKTFFLLSVKYWVQKINFKNSKFEKVKILVYDACGSKIDKKHPQGSKNLSIPIFDVLETNLDQNLIFEKKSYEIYPFYNNKEV
jgi:hypothetical protein